MFGEIAKFEIGYQTRQPVYWVSAFFLFLLTFLAITTDVVVLGGSIGNVNRNAPFVVIQMLLVTSVLGVFVTTAFVASTVLRDFDHRTQELFFTTPVRKRDYVFGRFLGALLVSVGIYLFVVLAILLGGAMPWLEPERVGPVTLAPYVSGLMLFVIPNVFFTAALFFSLATLTRSLMYTYGGLIGLFFGYLLAGNLLTDMENEPLAAVLDPFGGAALGIATKYWTVAERNTEVLRFEGPLLWNRLLWTGLAALVLGFAYARFSFTYIESAKARKSRERAEALERERPAPARIALSSGRPPEIAAGTRWAQLLHRATMEVRGVLRSAAFPVLLAFGILNMVGNSSVLDEIFGTPVYPVTHVMVNILQGAFLFVFIIVTIYSGELVWRERSHRVNELEDALPVPDWVFWGSKLAALLFVLGAILATAILTGVAIQAYHGYYHFELGLYAKGMFLVDGIPFALFAASALFLQVLSGNKYLGFLLMILLFLSGPILGALDFDHNLYQFASAPDAPYSDMNGYGHFVKPLFWFYLYWSFFAVVLLVLVHLFWQRGTENGFRARIIAARSRFSRAIAWLVVASGVAFAATGAYIFYNTNVLNEYVPGDRQEERQARFEKEYKKYEGMPKPRITSVSCEVDIHPETRAVDIRGTYVLKNKTTVPISTLHLLLSTRVEARKIELPGKRTSLDEELGYSVYELDRALLPGEEMKLGFDLAVRNPGFQNHGSNTEVVENGTFINNFEYFPRLGYQRDFELQDPNDRRKHELPPVQRMPSIEDAKARHDNYISNEADWIDFEAVIATSPDQVALAPGYLQREWTEGGRRYFHYKMDSPILGFFSFLSARWEVARDRWNDVEIEIYYHPEHPYNVPRMIDGVKKSLDYFTREFGPYQHRQVRVLEFPRYARFAQSFPNTIPFSESIGFIARLDDEDQEAIDYVFYVTAHEVAHQWWAHQVIGGFVQGATVMSETMSQYSALMVMEREYGPEKMRRFLKYELDSYLRGRGGELIEELPLILVENQPYIHYRKGSVVMYALKDYLGEEVLNAALRRYVEKVKFQEPPYTDSREFLSFLREATPEELQGTLSDLFEEITLYDNRATSGTFEKTGDGRYRVRLELTTRKFRATGQGEETEVPLLDEIDIGVFGETAEGSPPEGRVIYLEKRRLDGTEKSIEILVDEEPKKAGVDPFNKLIDRNPEDNVTSVAPRS